MKAKVLFVLFAIFSSTAIAAYEEVCTQSSVNIPLKPSTPTSKFDTSLHDGKVVVDNRYNLMWMRCLVGEHFSTVDLACAGSASTLNWKQALTEAGTVNAGSSTVNYGYNNWRVPNIKELTSIVEHQCASPALNGNLFPGANGRPVWSSTPFPSPGSLALPNPEVKSYPSTLVLYVDFSSGVVDNTQADSTSRYVRLVRDHSTP